MISQALVLQGNKILMVKQFVQRGDIVWNFPGGGIEGMETPEEACVREVKEETGYNVVIKRLLFKSSNKFTFEAEITSGHLYLNINNEDNEDILDIAWVSIEEKDKFDTYTAPLLELLKDCLF
ncbi:MAG: NUDIX hydrolase [Paenisporosarcina sp.]|uniref:NUDIX hydrolase n=1 Tax=Paenisporosarcina sp. TaxID=1932001 RepID=UPI003C74C3CD